MFTKRTLEIALAATTALALSGCVGTAPKPEYSNPDGARRLLDGDDIVTINVTAAPGIEILSSELQTLSELIEQQIGAMRTMNEANGTSDDYYLQIEITRFDKGNAFARAMLAGLGQIHIDGEVSLLANESKEEIDSFSIDKTVAWGGVYGGTTRIEDVMPVFAEGVAAALTGQAKESD